LPRLVAWAGFVRPAREPIRSIASLSTADLEAGYVWVNEVGRHVPGTPFGGVKDSGIGREEDLDELLSYTQLKNVHINYGRVRGGPASVRAR